MLPYQKHSDNRKLDQHETLEESTINENFVEIQPSRK